MPISLKLDKHLNIFGYYLLEGYLLFPTLPRNVGSVMSVNEHEHFKNRLTIWVCTKMLRLRLVHSLWYLRTFFQIVDFTGTGRPGNWWANLFPTFCKLPVTGNLFDTIQSQWKFSAFLWATSWSALAVQICYRTLVQSQIINLLLKCSCSLTVVTYISWYRCKKEVAL